MPVNLRTLLATGAGLENGTGRKPRIFITGSASGLDHASAETLLSQGCEVVVHVRSQERMM